MFGSLTDKFQQLFSNLRGIKTLTEDNISDAVRQIRLALLDADVNYTVASNFVKRVKEKAIGETVTKSVSAGQQFTKLVHEELIALMGTEESPLEIKGSPNVILLCGLQGSGKTTQCAKLAAYLKKKYPGRRILLSACDLQRPAAIEQLKKLGLQIDVPVYTVEGEKNPVRVAKEALEKARSEGFDTLIVDTAGRLHRDRILQILVVKALVAMIANKIGRRKWWFPCGIFNTSLRLLCCRKRALAGRNAKAPISGRLCYSVELSGRSF